MKKLIIFFQISGFLLAGQTAVFAQAADLYTYNGTSISHTFSLQFPSQYKVITESEEVQSFATNDKTAKIVLTVKEFEGQTYSLAINSYLDKSTELVKVEDFVFTSKSDYLAKRATYKNEKEFSITFIKHGNLIVSLTDAANNDTDAKGIYNSLAFNDNWHQYIDFENQFTFIFPFSLDLENMDNGLKLVKKGQYQSEIFYIDIFKDTEIEDAIEDSRFDNKDLEDEQEIEFHGISPAILAIYNHEDFGKKFGRIFVENGGTSISLTSTNIENNFPHFNYYDESILEMLESFEFFDIQGEYHPYLFFPDVRDNHPNAKAINDLNQKKIISGYPDGTFKPDEQINRAELTKLVVKSKTEPNAENYKDCFPDVTNQWFAPYICYAKEKNWIEGYKDKKFHPEQNVNRMEALKIILNALFTDSNLDKESTSTEQKKAKDVEISAWYYKYFHFADKNNLLDKTHILLNEDGTYFYYPDKSMTRKEVAETIYRSLPTSP